MKHEHAKDNVYLQMALSVGHIVAHVHEAHTTRYNCKYFCLCKKCHIKSHKSFSKDYFNVRNQIDDFLQCLTTNEYIERIYQHQSIGNILKSHTNDIIEQHSFDFINFNHFSVLWQYFSFCIYTKICWEILLHNVGKMLKFFDNSRSLYETLHNHENEKGIQNVLVWKLSAFCIMTICELKLHHLLQNKIEKFSNCDKVWTDQLNSFIHCSLSSYEMKMLHVNSLATYNCRITRFLACQ